MLTLVLFLASILTGIMGTLSGLGGGLLVVPLLTFGFGVELHLAVGASLVGVVATSLGSTTIFLRAGRLNLHLSLFLETASALGAVLGVILTSFIPSNWIQILFSFFLFYAVSQNLRAPQEHKKEIKKNRLNLGFSYKGNVIHPIRPWIGWFAMILSGVLSGLLGIGSGSLKILILERIMGIPFRLATALSSSMIGVTASVGAWNYWKKGWIDPEFITPLIPGVLIGTWIGSILLDRLHGMSIRRFFSLIIFLIGLKMLYNGINL